ncbi:MAG: NAD(P)/FAD-dependent oxidoreductase [Paracoccaceae bacterium]
MATVDVTVMGAGIFGLSIAYVCARRGARVLVIDRNGPGSGASGGFVGALAPHTPERWDQKKAFQFESLIMAEVFWAEVDALSGLNSGYRRTGRLQPIIDQHTLALAEERIGQAAEFWQDKAMWQVRPASDFQGWSPASPTGLLVHDTLSARINPRHACTSLAAAFKALGGRIVTQGEARTNIVWATGVKGLEQLCRDLGRPVGNGVKGQAALLDFEAREKPQIFIDGVHIVPHSNGTVAVGSTSERYFGDPSTTDEQLDDLLKRALAGMPCLASAPVIARWANVRPRSKSRAPILGAYPGRPGEYIANGGFKIGFGMAPKIAEIMADLVLDGNDCIPDDFRIEANF